MSIFIKCCGVVKLCFKNWILWMIKYTISLLFISVFCPSANTSLQAQEPRLKFCLRQVFHLKLRNQGCSFTRDWIGAVASHCFPHPTLSFVFEQGIKNRKGPRGTNVEVRRVDLANWALRTSPKFTIISSIRVFDLL